MSPSATAALSHVTLSITSPDSAYLNLTANMSFGNVSSAVTADPCLLPAGVTPATLGVRVLGFAVALVPAALSAASLSFLEAQQAALSQSRQLVAQDAAMTSAREMAVAAGERPDPMLSIGIDNLFNDQAYVAHPLPQRTFVVDLKVNG